MKSQCPNLRRVGGEEIMVYIGDIGNRGLFNRVGLEIDFYGEDAILRYDKDYETFYVTINEDGRELNMPIMNGDIIGIPDKKGDYKDTHFWEAGYEPFGLDGKTHKKLCAAMEKGRMVRKSRSEG